MAFIHKCQSMCAYTQKYFHFRTKKLAINRPIMLVNAQKIIFPHIFKLLINFVGKT